MSRADTHHATAHTPASVRALYLQWVPRGCDISIRELFNEQDAPAEDTYEDFRAAVWQLAVDSTDVHLNDDQREQDYRVTIARDMTGVTYQPSTDRFGGFDVLRSGTVLGKVINDPDGWKAYRYMPAGFVVLEFAAIARTRGSAAQWLVPQADDPCA